MNAVHRGPSSNSRSSGTEPRPDPKLSDEDFSTSRGPRILPVAGCAPVDITDRSGENGGTMKAPARWSPSKGDSHVTRKRSGRTLFVSNSGDPWPPKAMEKKASRPRSGSYSR